MHSSRMRTGHSLTICCSLLPGGVLPAGGVLLGPRRVCLVLGGSAWSLGGGGFSLPGGSAWSREGFSLVPGGGGLSLPGGFSLVPGGSPCWGGLPGPGGVSAWSRGCSPETPLVNRITHTCKNITLATTSLRPVIRDTSN